MLGRRSERIIRKLPYLVLRYLKIFTTQNFVPPGILFRAQILVDTKNQIALLWTPKSGATFTVRWFFAQNGLLDEDLRNNKFVHRYRDDIYRYSEGHFHSVAAFLQKPADYKVVKITRHPLKRTVSSYIHTNKHGFSDKKISRFLRRPVSGTKKYSFREFVSYLENLDIYKCNIHYRAQLHKFEKNGKLILIILSTWISPLKSLDNWRRSWV